MVISPADVLKGHLEQMEPLLQHSSLFKTQNLKPPETQLEPPQGYKHHSCFSNGKVKVGERHN